MNKILISAFTPFNKANNNYSKEVIDYIESNEFDIKKVVIDVVYDECFKELSSYCINVIFSYHKDTDDRLYRFISFFLAFTSSRFI